jgi:UDP-2,3-diacylglucosamine pyrophosphatase LpxH
MSVEGVGIASLALFQRAEAPARAVATPPAKATYYRTIWISDLHLGTPRCKAEALYDFLRHHRADTLYLVGDIVDGWLPGSSWSWSSAQEAVVRQIARWRRRGTRVVFLPGNHDHLSLDLGYSLFGPIPVVSELIHRTAGGRRMLVIHGHQFDGSLNPNRWLQRMGNQAYLAALRVDRWYSGEGRLGEKPARLPLSAYFKERVKKTVEYLTDFSDRAIAETARRHRADGVICGHVHRPEQRLLGPIWYINDGDWVSSCTAVVEDRNGVLALLRWERAAQEAAAEAALL